MATIAVLDLFVFGIIAFSLFTSYQHDYDKAVVVIDGLSRSMDDDLSRLIDKIDLTLLTVVDEAEREMSTGGIDPVAFSSFIARHDSRLPDTLGLRVTNAEGYLIHVLANVKLSDHDVSDREYYTRQRDNSSAGLFISTPFIGRFVNRPVIALSRRYLAPDGSFAGVVVIPVAVESLSAILSSAAVLGPSGRVVLWDEQHGMVTQYARATGNLKEGAKPSLRLAELIRNDSPPTVYRNARVEFGGIDRIAFFRKVSRWPLFLSLGVATRDVMAEWRREAIQLGSMGGLFLLVSVWGFVVINRSLMALGHREEELQALRQRYRRILDSAGDGIVSVDPAETVIYVNRAASRMLDVTLQDLEGKSFKPVLAGLQTAGPSGAPLETTLTRSDGTSFVAEYVLTPILQNDHFSGTVLVFRDISLRKQYEDGLAEYQRTLEDQVAERTKSLSSEISMRVRIESALRDSQGRLLAIASSLFEGVLLVDHSGVIVFANKSAHRWLGEETLLERELDEVLRLQRAEKALDFSDSAFLRVIESGETVIDDDAIFVTGNGKRMAVAFATSPLIEGDRRRMAIISFRDIGALKEAQRDALQSSRLASVGQLAAGIAHEINTPVQYIGDNLRFTGDSLDPIAKTIDRLKTLLDGTPQAEEAQRILDEQEVGYLMEELPKAVSDSLRGVEHVVHIVRSMKEFSHPGSQNKIATDINRAINSTITVSRNEWKHVATMETDLAPDLPSVICFPADINQVLLNLIVNAAHAIDSARTGKMGTIRISSRRDGDAVEIRVADSGPGVPETIRDKIFDPFFTTKGVGKGTGQGLSICQNSIVQKHGGRLYLDPNYTDGAAFVVCLPIGQEES